MQIRACRGILQQIERRFALTVQRHDFTIDHGIVRQRAHRLYDSGISTVEVVVVPRAQMHLVAGFDRERPVVINLISYAQASPSCSLSVRWKSMGSMKRALDIRPKE
jgi:hypothetical protein